MCESIYTTLAERIKLKDWLLPDGDTEGGGCVQHVCDLTVVFPLPACDIALEFCKVLPPGTTR